VIGVICKTGQTPVVEEFFQLFKTPWELYRPDRFYDVVLSTTEVGAEVNASLLVLFGPENKSSDAGCHTVPDLRHRGDVVAFRQMHVPIFGDVATFDNDGSAQPILRSTRGMVCLRKIPASGKRILRVGYDLFEEVQHLLSVGQPVERAKFPTLDLHIEMLRSWIVGEGIALLEIPPVPAKHSFTVCLTHDIDFIGIRQHLLDHTMWGFLYRSSVGAVWNLLRGRLTFPKFQKIVKAAASLPFVYMGWVKDFWSPFEWYLNVEKGLGATYFLIPFKRRCGEFVPGPHAARRGAAYDVSDLREWPKKLIDADCELGVHGIDAWHNEEKAREEQKRIRDLTDNPEIGIRMHWLLQDKRTVSVLEKAGYDYDSTSGYNETIGYRNGTTQVFRPLEATRLLELPTNIQDGALFYPNRMDLSETEAAEHCKGLMDHTRTLGGVLTTIWHDRSHGPERYWDKFYEELVEDLKSSGAWFATCSQAIDWFRTRRTVRFEQFDSSSQTHICPPSQTNRAIPGLVVRVYRPSSDGGHTSADSEALPEFVDHLWDGKADLQFDVQAADIVHCLPQSE
jgi:hypothetical protein